MITSSGEIAKYYVLTHLGDRDNVIESFMNEEKARKAFKSSRRKVSLWAAFDGDEYDWLKEIENKS